MQLGDPSIHLYGTEFKVPLFFSLAKFQLLRTLCQMLQDAAL